MKVQRKSVFFFWSICLSGVLLFTVSCSKNKNNASTSPKDNNSAVENATSITVFPGYYRAKISWETGSEVTKGYVVNGQDSVMANTSGNTMSALVEDLEEGNHTLYIYLYDNEGNRSTGSKVILRVYGDKYVSDLSNRTIQSATYNPESGVYIAFGDSLSSMVGTKITYESKNNKEITVNVDNGSEEFVLGDIKGKSSFSYQSMYLPDPEAIDTFYAASDEFSGFKEVNFTTLIANRILSKSGVVREIFSDTEIELTDGITETDLSYSNSSGQPMHAFILSIDLSNPKVSIKPTLANGGKTFSYQKVSEMASHSDKAGSRVIGAINADYFLYPPEPWNIVVLDNEIIKDNWYTGAGSYLAILKDGSLHMGNELDFDDVKGNIQNAIGGAWMIVNDYSVPSIEDVSIEPRTGIGYTKDETVYFIVVDGRSANYSNGCRLAELGEMFKAVGAQYAINLDGGGSSTFVTKKSDGSGWEVKNRPSDGNEREVINAWLAIADLD